jgi:hypothetical protein
MRWPIGQCADLRQRCGMSKFMRTLWVCDISGGPQVYAATKPGKNHLGLNEAHRALEISPEIFDEVAAELARSLDHFGVPEGEGRGSRCVRGSQGRGGRGLRTSVLGLDSQHPQSSSISSTASRPLGCASVPE